MSQVFDKHGEYARETHDAQRCLEGELEKLYDVQNVRIVPSGLAAIASVCEGFFRRHRDGLVCLIDELYSESLDLVCDLPHKTLGSVDDLQHLPVAQPILLFAESCSNPHGRVPDFAALRRAKERFDDFYLVIDNTWLSAAIFNPFTEGADLVVVSLTKYYSAGSVIAGAVLAETCGLFLEISDWITLRGLHVTPNTCDILLERLPSLADRMSASSARTKQLIEFLLQNNVEVFHPCVQQKELCANWPFVPSVVLAKLPPVRDPRLLEKTSYGGAEDRKETTADGVRIALGHKPSITLAELCAALGF